LGDDAGRRVPSFGIVTPTLNAGRYFDATLRSIWSQGQDLEIDHVVVDGGSTDATLDIARRYPSRILESKDDQGMYDAINRGMAVVKGDIVTCLNADDEIASGALRLVRETFGSRPDIQWLCGTLQYTDSEGKVLGRMTPVKMSLRAFVGLGWCPIAQQTMWARREFFDRVGPFDIAFRNTGDYDWIARAMKLAPPTILRETLGNWRIHGEMLSFDPEKMARESRMVQDRNGGRDGTGGRSTLDWLYGKSLSLRLNLSNPRWLVAKKKGKIRFS